MSGNSVFILAVEPSADRLGADLARAIKEANSDIVVTGIGGSAMAEAGVSVDFDISELAIMGYLEVLKSYRLIRRKIKDAVVMIMDIEPDAVVLIDSWGFMIRVAAGLRKNGYQGKIVKYVAPQVWAMRPGRAKTLAKFADLLLSIHTMDEPYFRGVGLAQIFVGNPMFDEDFSTRHQGSFRKQQGLEKQTIISVLFGSRPAEVQSLFEPFAGAVERLKLDFPEAIFATIIPSNVDEILAPMLQRDPRTRSILIVNEADKKALFADTNVALACSGTVTTQLAMSGTPSVVAYRLNALTYGVGKHIFRPDHISLVNISAGERIIPEFLQNSVTADNLSESTALFLNDENFRLEISEKLLAQVDLMKGKGGSASKRAALAISDLMRSS